jgi:hypothetical protein
MLHTTSPKLPSRLPTCCRFVSRATVKAAAGPPEKGGVGSSSAYTLRFYSTLPDTMQNNLRVQLGLLPEDAIVAVGAWRQLQWPTYSSTAVQ